MKLVYHSGRARGYLSTIELRLTPEVIPKTLKTISLRITIEGVLFEKTFEADPDLKYTYSWNRLNIYRWVEKKSETGHTSLLSWWETLVYIS